MNPARQPNGNEHQIHQKQSCSDKISMVTKAKIFPIVLCNMPSQRIMENRGFVYCHTCVSVSCSPDRQKLLLCTPNNEVCVVSRGDALVQNVSIDTNVHFTCIHWLDDETIFALRKDKLLVSLNYKHGKENSVRLQELPTDICLSPCKKIAVLFLDNRIEFMSTVETFGCILGTIEKPIRYFRKLAWSHNSDSLALITDNFRVSIWDRNRSESTKDLFINSKSLFSKKEDSYVNSVAWSLDGLHFAEAGFNGLIRRRCCRTWKIKFVFNGMYCDFGLARWSPDSKYLGVNCCQMNKIVVYRTSYENPIFLFSCHEHFTRLHWLSNSEILLVGQAYNLYRFTVCNWSLQKHILFANEFKRLVFFMCCLCNHTMLLSSEVLYTLFEKISCINTQTYI